MLRCSRFIQNNFSPPNVGVVGPLHKGGNEDILTYDFVHRTHINIFGYYYPRVFTDWWADNWISRVYGTQRTLKLPSVRLLHTLEVGQRYTVKSSREKYLRDQLDEDRITLSRCVLVCSTEEHSVYFLNCHFDVWFLILLHV